MHHSTYNIPYPKGFQCGFYGEHFRALQPCKDYIPTVKQFENHVIEHFDKRKDSGEEWDVARDWRDSWHERNDEMDKDRFGDDRDQNGKGGGSRGRQWDGDDGGNFDKTNDPDNNGSGNGSYGYSSSGFASDPFMGASGSHTYFANGPVQAESSTSRHVHESSRGMVYQSLSRRTQSTRSCKSRASSLVQGDES